MEPISVSSMLLYDCQEQWCELNKSANSRPLDWSSLLSERPGTFVTMKTSVQNALNCKEIDDMDSERGCWYSDPKIRNTISHVASSILDITSQTLKFILKCDYLRTDHNNTLKTQSKRSYIQCTPSPRFPKDYCFLAVPGLRVFLLVIVTCRQRWLWSIGGKRLTGQNWSNGWNKPVRVTLSTTNFIWNDDLGSNLGLRD